MTPSLAAAKEQLRAQLRARGRALTADERARLSAALCALLARQPVWITAPTVCLYSPLADEPDVQELLAFAWRAGKRTALPRYAPEFGAYVACEIKDSNNLQRGRFGILEPLPACPTIPANQLDLILAPGLGFAPDGQRLGRGKGYYDRLLAEVFGHKCGVAFDWQIVATVPAEPHDIRVNSIVTPTRWLAAAA